MIDDTQFQLVFPKEFADFAKKRYELKQKGYTDDSVYLALVDGLVLDKLNNGLVTFSTYKMYEHAKPKGPYSFVCNYFGFDVYKQKTPRKRGQ